MNSVQRTALIETVPVMGLTESYMAGGEEDYSTAFPNSVMLAEDLLDHVELVMTLEALIGSFAIERRIQLGELTLDDIPAPLHDVHTNVIERSSFHLPLDEQYDLAPLLDYYRAQFQR